VTREALGAGYVTFFLYSTAIGVFAVILAFVVARKQTALQARLSDQAESDTARVEPAQT